MNAATTFPSPVESAERGLKIVFENASIGIAVCSQSGMVTMANPAMEQILGGPIPSSLSILDLVGAAEVDDTRRLFRELMDGKRMSFEVEGSVTGATASASPVKWTAWRVEGCDGGPCSGLLIAEDPQGTRHSERRLRQAQKFESIGRIAGGVAHDFNNLVTGVLLYSDLLLAETDMGTRLRGYVEEIRAAGIQAGELVRQLLAASRPRESSPHTISLNTVLEGMRDLLVRLVGASGNLQFILDPKLGSVRMLPKEAQQILLNLVLNSRDAIADGGRICIETANCRVQIVAEHLSACPEELSVEPHPSETTPATLPCAVLSVSDNGIGMDAETQEHLFEAFFTTKTPDKGTGLGLTTVHDLVSSSGGLIYVDSAPGRGTRVTILLPLVPESITPSHNPTATVGHEGAPLQPEKEIIS